MVFKLVFNTRVEKMSFQLVLLAMAKQATPTATETPVHITLVVSVTI